MQLDNVRELKSKMLERFVQPVAAEGAAHALTLSARRVESAEVMRSLALGAVRTGKNKQFKLAIRIQRQELTDHPMIDQIKQRAKGEVDVRYVGRIQKRAVPWHQKKQRPLRIGCSIGHFNITAGTLGCFVQGRTNHTPYILSNNHVLADENKGRKGDDILQPGQFDGGRRPADVCGALDAFVRMKKSSTNFVDAALATITQGIKSDRKKLGTFGALAGVRSDPVVDEIVVHKVGRTTGQTTGRVSAFELDNVVVEYDMGNVRFDNQIEIAPASNKPFSLGGDSGSLIFDEDNFAVGLLFAGNDRDSTFANPIQVVLDALKVDIMTT